VSWVNPGSPPAEWFIDICFADGTTTAQLRLGQNFSGGTTTFDAFGTSWPGGFNVRLYGEDGNGNLLFAPSVSTDVTKNQ